MGEPNKNQQLESPEKPRKKVVQKSKRKVLQKSKRLEEREVIKELKAITFKEVISRKYLHSLITYSGDWDEFLPRFVISEVERIEGRFLSRHEQKFLMGESEMELSIVPSRILDVDGIRRNYYPGEREALLELCLIKFAVQNPDNFDGYCTLIFRLSFLQKTFAIEGWNFTVPEIEAALEVHSGTALILEDTNGKYCFRAINTISIREMNDGDLFYSIRLGNFLADKIKNLLLKVDQLS